MIIRPALSQPANPYPYQQLCRYAGGEVFAMPEHKQQNHIIGVAVRQGDLMICLPKPNRHHDCIRYAVDVLGLTPPIGAKASGQGFYLEDGTYLNRQDALRHVKQVGQPHSPEAHRHLFSEDLW